MRIASFFALAMAGAISVIAGAESPDYLDSKLYELGLLGEAYVPEDPIPRGGACTDGIYYDDGSYESYGSQGAQKAGFVQLFTVDQLPFQFDTVCVCLDRNPSASSQILGEIAFYADDGPNGAPGTLLGSVSRTISGITEQTPCSFIEIDLNDEAPLLTRGNVYIGLLYNAVTNPGIYIGGDTSANTPQRPIYRTFNGTDFTTLEGTLFEEYRAVAFRARGENICNEEVDGVLIGSSPRWDRVVYNGMPTLSCESVPSDSANDDLPYQVIPVSSPFGGLFTAEITSTTPQIDTVMMLYCSPFDPENPTANLIAYDDDGGSGTLSAFTASDGLDLSPGVRYELVVTPFAPLSFSDFRVCIGNGYTRERDCIASVQDTLGAASPHYDRIIAAGAVTTCTATTADTVQDNMPYAAIPFELNTGGLFEVTLNDANTSILDPVMTLYCDPFDPGNPGANVIAYDDNDGEGMMPAFTLDDGLVLNTNTKYWLVVSTWLGEDGDGGTFDLCFGGDVRVGYPVAGCEDDVLFGHIPTSPLDLWNGHNVASNITSRYLEYFTGLSDPIRALTWYGFIATPNPVQACSPGPAEFTVDFYADDGGEPGSLVYSETLAPTIVPTGIQYDDASHFQLIRYSANLSSEVFLGAGWLRIVAQDAESCTTYWILSNQGDSTSGTTQGDGGTFTNGSLDYAFCLYSEAQTTQHAADTDQDFTINLSELLRVIQFFNSNGYHCEALGEDGYAPGPGDESCSAHSADYNPADWEISLSELLRIIQFFNSGGYHVCDEGEDGYCPGL